MFRCGLATLLYYLVLIAGAGAHTLLLTNGISSSSSSSSSSSIAPRDPLRYPLHFVSALQVSGNQYITEVEHFPTLDSWMVKGGLWSCPACTPSDLERKYPALAKMHPRPPQGSSHNPIVEEIIGLRTVGQLLDYGRDERGTSWTIVRDMRVTSSGHRLDVIHNIISTQRETMTRTVCEEHYQKASNTVLNRMKRYIEENKILHKRVNTNNVLLDVTFSNVELVNWGSWVHKQTWNPEETETKNSITHMKENFNRLKSEECIKFPLHSTS